MKKTALKISISLFLFIFLFLTTDIKLFIQSLSSFQFKYVFIIITLLILNYVISSFRWKSLIIFENKENVKIWYLIKLYFTGAFFNNFMPTSIGGDVYKMFKLSKKINSGANAFSATFMERFTGIIALILISYVGLIFTYSSWFNLLPDQITSNSFFLYFIQFNIFLGFWIYICLGFFVLKFIAKKSEKINKLYLSLILYKSHKKVLLYAFLTSFIVQFIAILTQQVILIALGVDVPLMSALFIFPVITLISFFVPSLNGFGVQDYLYKTLFFINLGIPQATALAGSILYHLFRLLVSLLGGVFYAFDKET